MPRQARLRRAADFDALRQASSGRLIGRCFVLRYGNNEVGNARMGLARFLVGSELNYDAALEVTAVLGEACASTGWVYSLWTAHLWMIAQFPEHIQRAVFEGGRPLVSSCVNTVGKPERVEGGYRWTGKGFFSSGSDHSTWLTPAMESPNDDGTVERRWFLIPRSDYTILDDWYTMGLKATGSKTIIVDNVAPQNVAVAGPTAGAHRAAGADRRRGLRAAGPRGRRPVAQQATGRRPRSDRSPVSAKACLNVNACGVGPSRSSNARRSMPSSTDGVCPSGTHQSAMCTSMRSNHSRRRFITARCAGM